MTPDELRADLKKISEETIRIGDPYVVQIIQLFGGHNAMAQACLIERVTGATILTWRKNGIPPAKSVRDCIRSAAKRHLGEREAATVIEILAAMD